MKPEIEGNVVMGPDTILGPGVRLLAGRRGSIVLGRRCNLKTGVIIAAYGGDIRVGDRVSIGEYTVIYGHGGVTIGEAVAIGPHSAITSQEHIVGSNVPLRFSGERTSPSEIEAGAIVSAHCVITAGVRIGRNALVGAGSVVTDDIPQGALAFGSPCRVKALLTENPLYGMPLGAEI